MCPRWCELDLDSWYGSYGLALAGSSGLEGGCGRGSEKGVGEPVVTSPLAGSDLSTCLAWPVLSFGGGRGGCGFFSLSFPSPPDGNFPKSNSCSASAIPGDSTKDQQAPWLLVCWRLARPTD